jgi:hypothetical protein
MNESTKEISDAGRDRLPTAIEKTRERPLPVAADDTLSLAEIELIDHRIRP